MTEKTAPAPIVTKYSKSSAFYLNTKREFFAENKKLLDKAEEQNRFYASQPQRTACKVCHGALPQEADFTSHGVDYKFCPSCSHLNGCFDDTQAFVEKLYIAEDGGDYAATYIDKDYEKRVADIYAPKADFLISSLPAGKYTVLDVGCGSGYLVYALHLRGMAATGIDVSKTMVDFGNGQIRRLTNAAPLAHTEEDAFFDSILKSEADIVSAIGVIEHLREPHKFFEAFQKSRSRLLFYSVPMFSFSVILENIFPDVFPRQLSAGHTHLFTEGSIGKMNGMIGVRPIAEWRFGTDMMDLHRSIRVRLQANKVSERLIEYYERGVAAKVDAMQAVLDTNHFCSEIHCVAEKI